MSANACRNRSLAPRDWPSADGLDLAWHDAPTVILWADDGTALRYQLEPGEAYDLVRRLVGYLGYLHEPPVDRIKRTVVKP